MNWKQVLAYRLVNLLSVKSLITIILTIAFAIQAYRGKLDQSLLTVYTMIISFYFGTQCQKAEASTTATDKVDISKSSPAQRVVPMTGESGSESVSDNMDSPSV